MRIRQLRAFFVRLAGLFNRGQREREISEELEGHLRRHIEDNLRAGMDVAEARRRALIKLGGLTQVKERYRDRAGLPSIETLIRVVTPRYFEAMGIPLLAGRDFTGTDTKQAPNVVVINEAFARRHFAGESPLGHRIRLQGQERDPLLIVGVVGDVRDLGLDEQPIPEAYLPFLQDPLSKTYQRSMTIVARTKSDPGSIAGSLRAALRRRFKSIFQASRASMSRIIAI